MGQVVVEDFLDTDQLTDVFTPLYEAGYGAYIYYQENPLIGGHTDLLPGKTYFMLDDSMYNRDRASLKIGDDFMEKVRAIIKAHLPPNYHDSPRYEGD